jgi:hypothetical protein
MLDFKQIQVANLSIKTTNVQGKDYAEVNQRIKAFRSVCPSGSIITEIVSCENGVCIFKATVYDEEMRILGTGTAYEKEGSSFINKTSYIENCETSAVGRALGMCGFGIDTSICSAEELQNAILNQPSKGSPIAEDVHKGKKMSPRDMLAVRLNELGIDTKKFAADHGLSPKSSPEDFMRCLEEVNRR